MISFFKGLTEMLFSNEKKVNLHKKRKFKSSTLHIYLLIIAILCSVILSIAIYEINVRYHLKLGNTLTAYLAIIGSLPTVYLWIVKERKKEEELKNKQQEINQIKVSELNKVYVDAVNQFYNEKTFIAGAYALLALADDWINMSKDYQEKEKDYYPRVSQISSIIFSAQGDKCDNELFNSTIINLIQKITSLNKDNSEFSFDWDKVSLKNLKLTTINLTHTQLAGIGLVDSDFTGASLVETNFRAANLTNNNFSFSDLTKARFLFSNLTGADLTSATLTNTYFRHSILIGTTLLGADLTGADLTHADLTGADLTHADLTGADLTHADLTDSNLTGADLTNADLSGANLTNTNLTDAILDNAILPELSGQGSIE